MGVGLGLQAALAGVGGLVLGSFLLTISDRLQRRESWVRGRSYCESCKKRLAALELIPLFSYLVVRGRCRTCKKRISWWHPLSEAVLGASFALVVLYPFQITYSLSASLVLLAALWLLFVHDVRFGLLPDWLTLPPLVLAFGYGLYVRGFDLAAIGWWLLALAIGAGLYILQWALSRGKWVGTGDIRLGALIGLIVGWPHILTTLGLAYVGGALIAVVLLAAKVRTMGDRLPMAAFLIPAAVIVLWFGETILDLLLY